MPSTKDYERFTLLEFNREKVNDRHVGRLKTSIMKNGYLASNPIIVNKNFEVLDGQHRFTACKELGLPIQYKMIDDSNEREDIIITLNNTQRKWSISDYINYYAIKYNKEDYIRLQALCKGSNIPPTVVLAIANVKVSGSTSDRVAKGKLEFSLEDELRVVNFYDRARLIADSLRIKITRRYVESLLTLSQKTNFSWETMTHKARSYPTKAYPCISKEDFIIMLRDLYNYNTRNSMNKIQ